MSTGQDPTLSVDRSDTSYRRPLPPDEPGERPPGELASPVGAEVIYAPTGLIDVRYYVGRWYAPQRSSQCNTGMSGMRKASPIRKRTSQKPSFGDLMHSLALLCRAEKGGETLCQWLSLAVGSYEDAHVYLPQIIARTTNPVVAMLAKQALRAR
jgi:hypothetical protein